MVQNDSYIIMSIRVQYIIYVYNIYIYIGISEKRQAFLALSHGWDNISTFLLELLVSQKWLLKWEALWSSKKKDNEILTNHLRLK